MNRGMHTNAVWAAVVVVVGFVPAMGSDAPCPPAALQGKVVAVADGDTITVLVDCTRC
jgi:hypothetical protein